MAENIEIDPFVLFRVDGDQGECAVWRLADGQTALTLFTDRQHATNYMTVAQLGAEWEPLKPERESLVEIIRTSRANGIRFAVLNPDATQASRIFDLQEILDNVEGSSPP